MIELEQVPRFRIDDDSRRPEARRRFLELGRTLPMITVSFADIGVLKALNDANTEIRREGKVQLGREQQDLFDDLARQAFELMAETPKRLVVIQDDADPFRFTAGRRPLMARQRYPNLPRRPNDYRPREDTLDGGAHNDQSREGLAAPVYCAHLSTFGEGTSYSHVASGIPEERTGRLHFSESSDFTHITPLCEGDMNIFIRQAPSTDMYDSADGVIAPTTHRFYTRIGDSLSVDECRGFVEASFGLGSQW